MVRINRGLCDNDITREKKQRLNDSLATMTLRRDLIERRPHYLLLPVQPKATHPHCRSAIQTLHVRQKVLTPTECLLLPLPRQAYNPTRVILPNRPQRDGKSRHRIKSSL